MAYRRAKIWTMVQTFGLVEYSVKILFGLSLLKPGPLKQTLRQAQGERLIKFVPYTPEP